MNTLKAVYPQFFERTEPETTSGKDTVLNVIGLFFLPYLSAYYFYQGFWFDKINLPYIVCGVVFSLMAFGNCGSLFQSFKQRKKEKTAYLAVSKAELEVPWAELYSEHAQHFSEVDKKNFQSELNHYHSDINTLLQDVALYRGRFFKEHNYRKMKTFFDNFHTQNLYPQLVRLVALVNQNATENEPSKDNASESQAPINGHDLKEIDTLEILTPKRAPQFLYQK